jgi:hypothetical protein
MNRLLEGGQLFTSKQYLAKAVEYGDLAKTSVGSAKRQESKRSRVDTRCSQSLADNDELLQEKSAVSSTKQDETNRTTLAAEDHVLRCLGAALIMQWNTLPAKLKRELFDNAGDMWRVVGYFGSKGTNCSVRTHA